MQFTRNKLLTIYQALKNLPTSNNVRVTYTVSKNLRALQPVVDLLNGVQTDAPEFSEFERQRLQLCADYADKDSDGNPVIENNNYSITQKRKTFDNKIAKLIEDNKEVIAAQETKQKELFEFLNELEDVTLTPIKLDDFIAAYTSLDQNVMDTLFDLIQED